MSKNKMFLTGNLGDRIEFKEVGDKFVANFSVAESIYLGTDKPTIPQWWDCSFFFKKEQKDYYANCFKKGAKVLITGFLFQDKYEKEGKTIIKCKLLANEIIFYARFDNNSQINSTTIEQSVDISTNDDSSDLLPF